MDFRRKRVWHGAVARFPELSLFFNPAPPPKTRYVGVLTCENGSWAPESPYKSLKRQARWQLCLSACTIKGFSCRPRSSVWLHYNRSVIVTHPSQCEVWKINSPLPAPPITAVNPSPFLWIIGGDLVCSRDKKVKKEDGVHTYLLQTTTTHTRTTCL